MENRAVLVTGGAGYIGSHMVWALLKQNYNVIVIDSFDHGYTKSLDLGLSEKLIGKTDHGKDITKYSSEGKPLELNLKVYKGDLKNPQTVQKLFKMHPEIDTVIHFASYLKVGESVQDPMKYWENNVGGAMNLLNEFKESPSNSKNFIFSSTCAIFGQSQ